MHDDQDRPNVLVTQPDQHRGTIMGCADDRQVQTTNLDRLGTEGIRFLHATSSSPVCSSFRGTMQTGLYPHTHGVVCNNLLLDPELTGFAGVFAEAGYATGILVNGIRMGVFSRAEAALYHLVHGVRDGIHTRRGIRFLRCGRMTMKGTKFILKITIGSQRGIQIWR